MPETPRPGTLSHVLKLWVWGLGFKGLGFRGLGFKVYGLGCMWWNLFIDPRIAPPILSTLNPSLDWFRAFGGLG